MNKTIITSTLLRAAIVTVVGLQLSRGRGTLEISDVTQSASKTIKSPMRPFGNGALYVLVDGQLDGDATLLITSNHGRDHRTEVLSGTLQGKVFGGAEEWVDDLDVRFEPGSAKHGCIRISMACGKNLK